MNVICCEYPDSHDVIGILNQLRNSFCPFQVLSDEQDVYAKHIHRLETALDHDSIDKRTFLPILRYKKNAERYGPQYQISVVHDGLVKGTGSVNRQRVSLICEEPDRTLLFGKIVDFAAEIPGAIVEQLDSFGQPISPGLHP